MNSPKLIRIQLSSLFFAIFFAYGATIPILSLYLKDILGFSGLQTAVILAMSSIATILSPFFIFHIADKVLSAEKLLSLCQFFGSLLMFMLFVKKSFSEVFFLYTFYALVTGPSGALLNAIAFHNTEKEKENFGRLRVWGTIGWIAVGWFFSLFMLKINGIVVYRNALLLSAISSIIVSAISLTLPRRNFKIDKKLEFNFKKIFEFLMKKDIILICVFSLLVSSIDRYYYFGTSPFLKHIGFSDTEILPFMSIGQFAEVFTMFILGFMLSKFGYKKILLLGVVGEILRFSAFCFSRSKVFLIPGLSMHGISYTFYITAAYIYFDNTCTKENRTGAHQIYALLSSGIGTFLGNYGAGIAMDLFCNGSEKNFMLFWSVPLFVACFVFFMLLFFLKDQGHAIKA